MYVERLRRILREVRAENLLEGLVNVVREVIERFSPIAVLVTGSLARKRFVYGMSDIDILVITEKPVRDRFLLRAVENTDVEITIMSLDEVLKGLEAGNQFLKDAVENGLVIHGDIEGIAQMPRGGRSR